MRWKTAIVLALISLNRPVWATTQLDPLIGVRVSEYTSQRVLSSPPLPALDADKAHQLIPSLAYLVSSAGATTTSGLSEQSYSGSFKGGTFGLGLVTSIDPNLSFYGFALLNSLKGSIGIDDTYSGTPPAAFHFELSGMNNFGYNAMLGLEKRLIGSSKDSAFQFGVFGGPFLSGFTTKFVVEASNGSSNSNYNATSFVFGPMAGVQALLKIWKIRINPYALYYLDLSGKCQSFASDDGSMGPIGDSCSENGTVKAITLNGTFSSVGLAVGAYGLNFNVYSHIYSDSSLSSINSTSYGVSYGIDF